VESIKRIEEKKKSFENRYQAEQEEMNTSSDVISSLGTTAIFFLHYAHRVALGYSCDDFVHSVCIVEGENRSGARARNRITEHFSKKIKNKVPVPEEEIIDYRILRFFTVFATTFCNKMQKL